MNIKLENDITLDKFIDIVKQIDKDKYNVYLEGTGSGHVRIICEDKFFTITDGNTNN